MGRRRLDHLGHHADDLRQWRGKVYGRPNPAFGVTYNGFVNGDTPSALGGTLAFSTAATAASDVGSTNVTASGLASSNYAITYAAGSLTIIPKATRRRTIAWSTPAGITYGTPLSGTQLNATVTRAGPALPGPALDPRADRRPGPC